MNLAITSLSQWTGDNVLARATPASHIISRATMQRAGSIVNSDMRQMKMDIASS